MSEEIQITSLGDIRPKMKLKGTVKQVQLAGAIIDVGIEECDALLHISQIRRIVGGKRVENVEDVLNVGDRVEVEISELDPRGKISLHAVVEGEENAEQPAAEEEQTERRPRRERFERGSRRGSRQRRRTHTDSEGSSDSE